MDVLINLGNSKMQKDAVQTNFQFALDHKRVMATDSVYLQNEGKSDSFPLSKRKLTLNLLVTATNFDIKDKFTEIILRLT